jgi:hypothetical protein
MAPTAGQSNTVTDHEELESIAHLNTTKHYDSLALTVFSVSGLSLKQEKKT